MNSTGENIRYCVLIGMHTMTMCVGFNYVTWYLSGVGLKDSAIGSIIAVSCLIAVFIQQLAGRQVDTGRIGGKKLLCFVSLVEAMCAYGLLITDKPAVSGFLYGMLLAITLIMVPLVNSLSFYYRSCGITVNYGYARGIGSLCFSGISMLLGILTVHSGNFVVPLSYGILGAALFAVSLSFPDLMATGKTGAVDSVSVSRRSLRLSEHKCFLWMLIGLSLVMLFHNMLMTYFIYVIERAGGNSGDMGMAVGVAAVVEIPVLFLYTRVRKDRPSAGFLTISGFAFLLKAVLFIFAKSVGMIYLIQCLQCLAYGLMAASRVYYVDETVGEENEATGQAYIAATETIGLVLGSALGGLIMQNLGLETLLVVGAVACAAGASFMLLSNLKK